MHNLSCENEFYLHKNGKSFPCQRLSTLRSFDTQVRVPLCAHLISTKHARILDPRAQALDPVCRMRMQPRERWILRIRFRDQSIQRVIRHRPNIESALPE